MSDPFLARTLTALAGPSAPYARTLDTPPMLDLSVGEVQYPMPDDVTAELVAVVAPFTRIWYSDPSGEPDLRRAFLRSRFTDTTEPENIEQVLITSGGKEAAWLAVRYLLNRTSNRTALTPTPGWEPYRLWLHAAGCHTVAYDPAALAADPGSLRGLVGAAPHRPGLLIVNYPHNPTGLDIDQQSMDALLATAVDLGLDVVSDEVYRAFSEAPVSAMLAPAYDAGRHLVVDSCSKWLAVAGLRVGFLHADADTITALTGFRATYASCTASINQAVALTLMTNPVATRWLDTVRATVRADRETLAVELAVRGVRVESTGGLYVWCRRPAPAALASVSTAPARITLGDAFGEPGHVRICPARSGLDPQTAADAVAANLRGE